MGDNQQYEGRYILQAGWIGIGGSAELARKNKKKLLEKLDREFVEDYINLSESIIKNVRSHILNSRIEERLICEMGDDGMFGALWRLSEDQGSGLRINMRKILIPQEVIEICELTGDNPYKIPSRGSFLIVDERTEDMKDLLESHHVPCEVIGKLTGGRDRLLVWRDRTSFLNRP